MDSTPVPIPKPTTKPSPRKLPIKRKTPPHSLPDPDPDPNPNPIPIPNPNLASAPKFEHVTPADADIDSSADGDGSDDGGGSRKPPPFKFHRIWTETDEIRFLQGLLACFAHGLYFPRDLQIFYGRFSGTMSQPYTKSQLSEKLRRLRKKFRVTSSRLARGLDLAKLSPHDRELFELSKKLWHPDYSSGSPFSNPNPSGKKKMKHLHNLVGVEVSFSPTLPFISSATCRNNDHSSNVENDINYADNYGGIIVVGDSGDANASEANVDNDNCVGVNAREANVGDDGCAGVNESLMNVGDDSCAGVNGSETNLEANVGGGQEEMCPATSSSGGLGGIAARTAINVFDQSLKEVRMVLETSSNDNLKHGRAMDFEKRWREQQVAEFDVLARRLRLVLENAFQGH